MEEELFAEKEQKPHQAIGGLKERCPRFARYDRIDFVTRSRDLYLKNYQEHKPIYSSVFLLIIF
jgi:hypothetical protein